MQDIIKGKAYVLGDNIDTDQIIPAEHLVYSLKDPEERKLYGKYALVGVPEGQRGYPKGDIPFIEGDKLRSDFQIIIGGENFGCGSSREHAPFALREAGVTAVIAQTYARIFFRNSVDGGFYPPIECTKRLVDEIHTGDDLEIHIKESRLINHTQDCEYELNPLGDVIGILKAGNVFAYAKEQGMIS